MAVLAGPPTEPVPLADGVWNMFSQVAGYVKWASIAILIAATMLIGALLIVDNRLVDQYGPSIQAITIKVLVGSLLVATSAQIAELFV